jgi:hypothetical protein
MASIVTLHDISSQYLPAPVAYSVLSPDAEETLPLCILLLGAGGTRDSLRPPGPIRHRLGRGFPPTHDRRDTYAWP